MSGGGGSRRYRSSKSFDRVSAALLRLTRCACTRASAIAFLVLAAWASSLPVALWSAFGLIPQEPDRADQPEDRTTRRGPEVVYANVEAGYQSIDLDTLVARNLRPEGSKQLRKAGHSTASAAVFASAFSHLGGRVRKGDFHVFDLTTIDGELGARVSINRFEPYFTFGAGYAKLQTSLQQGLAQIRNLDIHGFNGRAGVGADYYADKAVTIGVNFTGDLVAMAKPGIDLWTSPRAPGNGIAAPLWTASPTSPRNSNASPNVLHEAEGTSFGFLGWFRW